MIVASPIPLSGDGKSTDRPFLYCDPFTTTVVVSVVWLWCWSKSPLVCLKYRSRKPDECSSPVELPFVIVVVPSAEVANTVPTVANCWRTVWYWSAETAIVVGELVVAILAVGVAWVLEIL